MMSEPGSKDAVRDPDRRCKVSVPASKGWKPAREDPPIVVNLGVVVVQALEVPTPDTTPKRHRHLKAAIHALFTCCLRFFDAGSGNLFSKAPSMPA